MEHLENIKNYFGSSLLEMKKILTNFGEHPEPELNHFLKEKLLAKIENKETENEILKQQLQMYKEQKDLMKHQIEFLQKPSIKKRCISSVQIFFKKSESSFSVVNNTSIVQPDTVMHKSANIPCSFSNIPDEYMEIAHSINSIKEEQLKFGGNKHFEENKGIQQIKLSA